MEAAKKRRQPNGRKVSVRSISIDAGIGESYLHELLNSDKVPSLELLMKLADELEVSFSWLALGIEMDRKTEKIVKSVSDLPDLQKDAVLRMIEAFEKANS